MYFLDNSAHIFELPDYTKNPIGYEYNENDYIFWFEDINNNTRLSINNYYGKIINVLYEIQDIKDIENTNISSLYNIEITCDSENFKLIRADEFQKKLQENESILDSIDINSKQQTKKLSSDNENDILIIKVSQDNKNYIMIPIYIVGISKYTGTWLTNILIHISNKFTNKHNWCPITIGGIFNDEYEALVIHGKNMGINLPKEILKAINGTLYDNNVFDEELYNKKIKEYLLNYMNIKGELGNYNSAINALNWFGYQNTVELYKLLETDNKFQIQYIRDYFDIHQDIIQAYNNFLNSQFIGLKYKLNTEIGKLDTQNINSKFWGEGLPLLEDNIGKYKMINTNEFLGESNIEGNQQFKYSSMYMDYTINELMFKLSYLKYYYQTYFLPIFIILKNLYIEYKVYTTPNKYLTYTHSHIFENIINNFTNNEICFSNENILYFTHQYHIVDEFFNEYNLSENDYKSNNKTYYEINDTCLYIPISIKMKKIIKYHNKENLIDTVKYYYGISSEQINNNINEYEQTINLDIYEKEIITDETISGKYCNCIFILIDNDLNKIIYKSNFSFINNENNKYLGFIFYPKIINELYNKLYTYINKNYVVYINLNNNWYKYQFMSKIHEFDVHLGTLEYQYWNNDINYFNNKLKDNDGNYIDNANIIFTIHNIDSEDIKLDITNYIKDGDFFDLPSKYLSNFNQIKQITEDKVIFNIYMNDSNFIYLNDINFGLWKNILNDNNITTSDEIELYVKNSISELINDHHTKINLLNNYKYLNNIHMYSIYEKTLTPVYLDENNDQKLSILRYKPDLSILCDNILIQKSHIGNEFTIINLSESSSNEVNSLENYNYYLFEHVNDESSINTILHLQESNEIDSKYYFILERDINGFTGNNADNLFSYYNNIDDIHEIGYIILPINLNDNKIDIDQNILSKLTEYSFNQNYNISNLSYSSSTSKFYYEIDNDNYEVEFTFEPVIKKLDADENDSILKKYSAFIYESNNVNTQIYAKLKLYYYTKTKILNLYGYYNTDFCNNLDEENLTCTINFRNIGLDVDPIENVKLYLSSNVINYIDIKNNISTIINYDNPSLYWVSDNFSNNINSINDINLNNSEDELINESPTFINYLVQNLTGYKGNYIISVDSENDGIILCVDIFDKDNNTFNTNNPIPNNTYNNFNDNNLFTLNGDENLVIAYFKFNNNQIEYNQKITFTPYIQPCLYKESEMIYNPNQPIIDIYKKFFYKKYSISVNQNSTIINSKEIWDSYINIDEENLYDAYLMHGKKTNNINDPEYWYFMFISKNTCDDINLTHSLYNYPEIINFDKYKLKHDFTKQLFLINRMKVNYVDNVNHFNGNEMIVCTLHNNEMLPTNVKLNSKWKLKPISYGTKTNNVIYANSNTAIISIPNSNTYDKGYYNIQVNYSLDGNINEYQTINKKILIK